MNKTLIIAEAGVNHNGSEDLAFDLVDAAHQAGADIVKFQTFKASNLVTENAKQAQYQVKNTSVEESQLKMLERLELSFEVHKKLIRYCEKLKIGFLSTAFDRGSLHFLVEDLGLQQLKISSGELTNAPFLLDHARIGCELIISTGMASLAEIEQALSVIAFGFVSEEGATPTAENLEVAYSSDAGQKMLREKVTLLHCTTEYPAPFEDVNLKAMDTISNAFSLKVGYSDHTAGITIPIASVARGAAVIEKHFTLDKGMEGPDHKASLEPDELKEMVLGVRQVEKAIGHGVKMAMPSEVKNKSIARKSLVAKKDISIGDVYCEENLDIKRPGGGMSPYQYWELIGKVASKNYSRGDLIDE